jgi:hypothetical protein
MNKKIYKYELKTEAIQTVKMPVNAEILAIQTQHETPCIWALVDPNAPLQVRAFETFGTGHDVHYDMGVHRIYKGTYQLANGALVFHVFERLD